MNAFTAVSIILFWVPLGFVLYHWVVFPALLIVAVRLKRRRHEVVPTTELPHVTIAICAWNEEKCIGGKITNCLALNYPADKLEIAVGSDGSDDRTDSIVRAYDDKRVSLFRLETRSGKPSVLNMLIREAVGDLVLFTDADVMLDAGALKVMAARFDDPSVGAVHAHYRRVNCLGNPAEGLFDRFEAALKDLEGRLGAMVGAYGWALLVRRELCESLPTDTILDDFLIGIRPFRRGYSVVYEPTALCWSRVETENLEFLRKVRISRGNVQALVRNADLLSPVYGVKAWVYFSHKVLRMMVPFLLASMLVGSALRLGTLLLAVLFFCQLAALVTTPLLLLVRGGLRRFLLPQYYYYMNIALLVGYWQYWFSREQYWTRTPRELGS